MTRRRVPGRLVEKLTPDEPQLIVGQCAGCGRHEEVLREVNPDVWRCARCYPVDSTGRTAPPKGA